MICIIDYGVGNLKSVEKAFQFIGAEAIISSDPDVVSNASKVVLPGVGAYLDAMRSLESAQMIEVVKDTIDKNKPFLGICLGMQLLFEYSEEGGERVPGLGIFEGSIKKFPEDLDLKVPHMGWNKINFSEDSKLYNGIKNEEFVYFVHSYYLTAKNREIVSSKTNYGIEFDSSINYRNIFATQFHPEKSGKIGLKILENFMNLG